MLLLYLSIYFFCEGKLQFLDSGHVSLGDPSRDWVPCAFLFLGFVVFPEFSIWTYFDFFSLVFLHEFSFLGGALYGFCWVGVTGA